MFTPTASVTRGVPVTVTSSSNSTVTSISSPARKTPPAPRAVPETVTPVTVGATTSAAAAFTTMSPSVIAWLPRSSVASLLAASRIVPPFSVSAAAPTLTPSVSVSPFTTV